MRQDARWNESRAGVSKDRAPNQTPTPVSYASRMGALILMLLIVLLDPTVSGASQLPVQPATGRVLIANPQLRDPGFVRSVVLLLAYGEQGAMGLVLNRPTEVPLAQLMPEDLGWEDPEPTVYQGGPVQPAELRLLVRSQTLPLGAVAVLPEVYLAADPRTLQMLREGKLSGANVRAYAGYAGWAPGQLDRELARGDWSLGPGTAGMVFEPRPEQLWPRLIRQWGGLWARGNPRPHQTGDHPWSATL